MLLHNGQLVLADAVVPTGWLRTDGSMITELGAGAPPAAAIEGEQVVDLDGAWLLPGFIDLHVHGGGGASYLAAADDEPRRAHDFHRQRGTTTTLASLVTATPELLLTQVSRLASRVLAGELAGIHLEGPFLSAIRCGAHDLSALLAPDPGLLRELLATGLGTIRMVTLAPELPNAFELIDILCEQQVVAAVGHTDATYAIALRAFGAGASVATHLFNGMRGVHHRDPGPVIAAIRSPHVVLELINDGVHVHPALVGAIVTTAGEGRVAFITDATAAAGSPDGNYELGGKAIAVRDGVVMLADGSSLAGSTLTQDDAFRRAVLDAGITPVDASRALSGTPAAVLGIADQVGALEVGKIADIVVIETDLSVARVLAKGTWLEPLPCGGESTA